MGARGTGLTRRGFLRLGAASVAGLLWDPELMLWRPPKVLITVPAMPIQRLTLSQIVAVTYEKVINEQRYAMVDRWSDAAFLQALENGR